MTVALVAAAVAAVAGVGAVLAAGGDRTGRPGGGPEPAGWRTEYWNDLQVDVPSDWAYGGAPMRSAGDTVACFASAMVSVAGKPLEGGSRLPYVGRPITLTDLCQVYPFIGPDAGPPAAPYVWLGADVEPGTDDLGAGWVQETVEVNGSTVTVATDDPDLRRRILDSATGGETCMSEIEPAYADTFERTVDGDPRQATNLTVCAYRALDDEAEVVPLVYAARLDRDAVDAYLDAVAGATEEDRCPTADVLESEWVSLELGNADGDVLRRDVVHFACPGIDVDAEDARGFETAELTRTRSEPWSGNGVRAVLAHFIGPIG